MPLNINTNGINFCLITLTLLPPNLTQGHPIAKYNRRQPVKPTSAWSAAPLHDSIFIMKIITDERCAGYAQTGHPESPRRITATLERLKSQAELPVTWDSPGAVDDATILRAHSPAVL